MRNHKITGKVISIQFGRDDTQIVLMGKGEEVISGVSVATPAGAVEDGMIRNSEAVREMLKKALQENPEFKRVSQVVFSLCTSQIITETVSVPDLPTQKLDKLLRANMDVYFPMDMQDHQLVWQIIGPKGKDGGLKELNVQLWAVPKAILAGYYAVANTCGLSVAAIDYCGHSVASAVGASFAQPGKAAKDRKKLSLNSEISFTRKKKEASSVSDAAQEGTKERQIPDTDLHISLEKDLLGMTFVQNGQVVLQRFVRCGAQPENQFGELAMMVEYFRSLEVGRGSQIHGILSGSLAGDEKLAAELADVMGISLTALETGYDPRWMLCAGAALTALDFGDASLNRPGKVRRQVESQIWQYALILAGGIILVAVLMFTFSSRLIWSADIRKLESTKQTLTIQAQQSAGYSDNYNKYVSLYEDYSTDWDTVFGYLRTYNDNLVRMLEELEEILPQNTSVTNMQIAPDGLTVEFASQNKEAAAYLIMALRELQYAELAGISDLRGGGAGAATSYGSGTQEAPPTEGSYELGDAEREMMVSLIVQNLSEEELMEVAMSLSPEQIDLLEEVYGAQAETTYSSLTELKSEEVVTHDQRTDAFRTMLNENPFAANRFAKLLQEDFERSTPILWLYILDDLLLPENKDMLNVLMNGGVNDSAAMQEYMGRLMDILTLESNFVGTERLLCTDRSMELWYIYYIEVEIGLRSATDYPYLNMDKIAEDLLQGGFNTGDADLDSKLNGLIPPELWALLEMLNKPGDDSGLPGGLTEAELEELLNKYLTTGSTGNTMLDQMIESYLTTGSTGNTEFDKIIEDYLNSGDSEIPGGFTEAELEEMLNKYLTTGSTGNTMLDNLIDKYIATGTTGNTRLDEIINDYLNNNGGGDSGLPGGFTEAQLQEMLEKYLSTGTTGNPVIDNLLNNYLTTGSTGNAQLDQMIEDYLGDLGGDDPDNGGDNSGGDSDLLGGYTEAELLAMLNKYLTTGTTGNALMDNLINRYMTTGSTGNAQLDKIIKDRLNDYITDDNTGGDSLEDLLDSLLGGNTGGTGNGGVQDTRIHFTVALSYKDELRDAELLRKGLYYSDKINKLEVQD